MKYINTQKEFKENKINEEFIGKMLKNVVKSLKKKASIGLSKKFGSSKKTSQIIEKYKEEIIDAIDEKRKATQSIIEYEKGIIAGGDKDENKRKGLLKDLEKITKLFEQKKQLIKSKYEKQLATIIKDEPNEDVKDYITLLKLEMSQELVASELNMIQNDLDVSTEDIQKSKYLKELVQLSETKLEDINTELQDTIEGLEKEKDTYPFSDGEKGWDNFEKYKFEVGEEIKYFSKTNSDKTGEEYKGTVGFIGNDLENENGELAISLNADDLDNVFYILKSRIIDTKKNQEDRKEEKDKDSSEENNVEI